MNDEISLLQPVDNNRRIVMNDEAFILDLVDTNNSMDNIVIPQKSLC